MKKQLQKKFYAVLPVGMAFNIMMMFSIVTANAQIVYTDIIPDTTLSNPGTYDLDINNDGQIDFTFYGYHFTLNCACGSGITDTSTLSPTSLSWVSDTINGQSAKLNSGDLINASSPLWTNAPSQILFFKGGACSSRSCSPLGGFYFSGTPLGTWSNVADKYLALKIQVSGSIYYGWARLDVDSLGFPITIKDYAYNPIPDSAILAGQTITGITKIFPSSSIALYPNPATNQLTIALGSNNKKAGVTITDITGKIIYTAIARETQKIEVNTKDFTEGIYVVQIQAADFIGTKKLVVAK